MDHYTHSEGWILDAMTINIEEGTLIYKATPRDVNSKSRVGVLEVRDGSLTSVKDVPISPRYLERRCGTCAVRRDAFRFNAAAYASVGGAHYIVFVGSSRTVNSDTGYYPSVFKIRAETSRIIDEVDGDEMYFDGDIPDRSQWMGKGGIDQVVHLLGRGHRRVRSLDAFAQRFLVLVLARQADANPRRRLAHGPFAAANLRTLHHVVAAVGLIFPTRLWALARRLRGLHGASQLWMAFQALRRHDPNAVACPVCLHVSRAAIRDGQIET